jgi:two-component system, OmpR family, sensor kinase
VTQRRQRSLTAQLALVAALVAAIAVLVTGLVSYPLVAQASENQARDQLATQADIVSDLVARAESGQGSSGLVRLRTVLAAQGITVQVVRRRGPQPPVTEADLAVTQSGGTVSDVRSTSTGLVFVEGRQVSDTTSVFLVQDASVAGSQTGLALRRLTFALLVGLVVAVGVGVLAARRVVRPLRDAAHAAERMATGARDVALVPEGPAEVASVSQSLNRLSAALATSEGRQRDFLLSVSHELRTPLTGITGYAEALADGVVPPADVAATGATVLAESHRLERLVADLLDLSRLGAADVRLAPVAVDLTALGADAAQVWGARCAREGVLFTVELPAGPVVVRTDPLRVRQIVDNLAENALRVTPAGRPLVLAVRAEPTGATIEVRDGGPGLTADDVSVAFEPAALHERYHGVRQVGTGVGLALVGRLATRLGGRAFAGTAPEGGALLGVMLPRDVDGAPSAPTLGA